MPDAFVRIYLFIYLFVYLFIYVAFNQCRVFLNEVQYPTKKTWGMYYIYMSNCYIYIPGPSYFWGLPSMVPTFFFVWGEIQRQSFRRFQHLGKVTRYGNVPTITWPSFTYIWPGIWLVFFEWLKTTWVLNTSLTIRHPKTTSVKNKNWHRPH